MKRYFVVEHIDGQYSIQTDPKGDAEMLDIRYWDYSDKELAYLLCSAANAALDSLL